MNQVLPHKLLILPSAALPSLVCSVHWLAVSHIYDEYNIRGICSGQCGQVEILRPGEENVSLQSSVRVASCGVFAVQHTVSEKYLAPSVVC